MSNKSQFVVDDYLSTDILGQSLWIALIALGNVELNPATAIGYARQALDPEQDQPGHFYNASAISFGPVGSDWGAVVTVSIYDAQTDGNLLYKIDLAVPKTILTGANVILPVGVISVQENYCTGVEP